MLLASRMNGFICPQVSLYCKISRLVRPRLHSDHDTSVLIPPQQRILPAPHLCLFRIAPPREEVLVRRDPRQPPRDRAVHVLHHSKVRREQDVEVPLLHERRPHGHRFPLVPRLDDGRVEARRRVGQRVEVGRDEPVRGEVPRQDVEEVHQARRDVLGQRQVGRERHPVAQVAHPARVLQRVRVLAVSRGDVAHAQEARCDGVELLGVELVEVAFGVDEDLALQGLVGEGVVADGVVREVVEDFHGEEEAGRRDVLVPVEDGLVDDFDLVGVAFAGRFCLEGC